MFKGISAHAGMSKVFPVERFMQQFPLAIKRPAITLLPGSFGWRSALPKAFCAAFADRPHMIECYLSNGCARRAARKEWTDFEVGYSISEFNRALESKDKTLTSKIIDRLDRIQTTVWAHVNANTLKLLCVELEDNMTDKAAAAFIKIVQRWDPTLITVRNPLTGGRSTAGAKFLEKHGRTTCSRGQIANTDGWGVDYNDGEKFFQHISMSSVKKLISQSTGKAFFLWNARQQGYPDLQNWADKPLKKDRHFEVTDEAIAGARMLLK